MNKYDLRDFLYSNIPNAKYGSNKRQIICNCIFPGCNDTKGHLYIGPFSDNNTEPVMYNCYKCKHSGIVNLDFLSMFGLDNDLGREVVKSNKTSSYRVYTKNNNITYSIHNTTVTECKLSDYKLKFINDRLGTNLTYQDCFQLKIVLNLMDLLKENNIKYYTRHESIIMQLNNNFIGFISRSNGSLNMRNLGLIQVNENINAKYINYNLFNNIPKDDYYIIPSTFNNNEHIKVYIAEGPFDILSIYLNLVNEHQNSIFIAGKGKAYLKAIEFLITTYGIYDFEIHYYPDKDITDGFMNKIIRILKSFSNNINVYIHRNVYPNEKDFGVPINRIQEIITKY